VEIEHTPHSGQGEVWRDAADVEPSPWSWRTDWRLWVALAVILVALTVTLWYLSDADLAAIDRRAATMGVPSSWQAVGLVRSDDRRIRDWRRLEVLATAMGSYGDSYGESYDKNKPPMPGVPVPPELTAYHAKLPTKDLADLLAVCDGLAAGPVVLHTTVAWSTPMPEIDAARRVCRLLAERAALVEPHAVADETERMLRLATAHQPASVIHGIVAISQLAMWTKAASRRLQEPGVDRKRLAQQAGDGRRWLATAMPQAWRGEYVFFRQLMHQVVREEPAAAVYFARSVGLADGLANLGVGRPMMRYVRGNILATALDLLDTTTGAISHRHRLATVSVIMGTRHSYDWSPSYQVTGMLLESLSMSAASWAKVDAGLAVVEAEILGTAWPEDPMDPSGHAVRRIERDGRLIGYYLVGNNGVDDGGRTLSPRDECFPLYERLGEPRAADRLPPPPVETPSDAGAIPQTLPPAYYFNK
jgi:hypothetical protein